MCHCSLEWIVCANTGPWATLSRSTIIRLNPTPCYSNCDQTIRDTIQDSSLHMYGVRPPSVFSEPWLFGSQHDSYSSFACRFLTSILHPGVLHTSALHTMLYFFYSRGQNGIYNYLASGFVAWSAGRQTAINRRKGGACCLIGLRSFVMQQPSSNEYKDQY